MKAMALLNCTSRLCVLVVLACLLALTPQLGHVSPVAAATPKPYIAPHIGHPSPVAVATPKSALTPQLGHQSPVTATKPALVKTYTVNSYADVHADRPQLGDYKCEIQGNPNVCTLRAAIEEADALPSGSSAIIKVPAGQYYLNPTVGFRTLLFTTNTITINGAPNNGTVIRGNGTFTIMENESIIGAVGLNNLRIIEGYGKYLPGGGIDNNYGSLLTVTNCTLSNNTANFNLGGGGGGGIYNEGSLTVLSSTFSNNTAANGNGGGIDNVGHDSKATVIGGSFFGNTASNGGGGIANAASVTVNVTGNSTLRGNSATDGGGIYNTGGTVNVTGNSTLSRNSATDGGGIYNDASGSVSVIASTLSGNIASNNGGGIENAGGTVAVTSNSNIVKNTVTAEGAEGGGIDNRDGRVTVDSSSLSFNSATNGSGGGISADGELSGATTTVTNSTLSKNRADDSGGGMVNLSGTLIVTTSTIAVNFANAAGGGIFSNVSGTVTVTDSTLSHNLTASYGMGGGLYNGSGTMDVNTSTLNGNSANDGGGIYEGGGATTVSNSTVAGNSATFAGGGIYIRPGSGATVTVTGTIVANSSTGGNCSGPIIDHGYNLEYTNPPGLDTCGFILGTDITGHDPLLGPLKDNGGPTWTMALPDPSQGPSPAVDTGSTSCPLNDQRGKARPDDGAGTACDIGAYEFSGDGGGCLPHSGTSQVAQSNVHTHGALPHTGSPQAPQGNLVYHGGPVMCGTVNAYAIFWEPTGSYVSPTYNSLIMQYFGDVGGSGLYHNNTQYPDSQGNAPQNAVLGGSWVDTHAYPSNPISDAQVQQEVTHAQSVNGWTSNTLNIFFVFTAKGENICSSFGCSFQVFCAYHGFFGSNSIYAAMPYAGTDLSGCGVPSSPNNDFDSDSTINLISHEQIEGATDPQLNAWFDPSGQEIGDLCSFNFGSIDPYGGDVNWNGHEYMVQKEWDNAKSACELSGP